MQDLRARAKAGQFRVEAAEIGIRTTGAAEAVIDRRDVLADAQAVQPQHPAPGEGPRRVAVKNLHCRIGANPILAA